MQGTLLDSSVYIPELRGSGSEATTSRFLGPDSPVWLSAVVLEELYAGAANNDRRVVERLERDFRNAGRILVPSLADWVQTGLVLSKLAARYGYEQIGRSRLTNDALIAVSAGRCAFVLVTANERDFGRIAEFRAFSWRLA